MLLLLFASLVSSRDRSVFVCVLFGEGNYGQLEAPNSAELSELPLPLQLAEMKAIERWLGGQLTH